MKQSGIETALASSANEDELETYKAIAQISDLVDTSTTADDVKRSKPHPDIFETALRRLGVKPDPALALGDTPWDAESAGKAGVRTVGVTTGGWTEQELYDAGCIEARRDVGSYGRYKHAVVVFNATRTQATFTDSRLVGLKLHLPPVEQDSGDPVTRESTFDSKTGTATVPALTTAVFVADRN